MKKKKLRSWIVVALLVAFAGPAARRAVAAEWSVSPSAELDAQYDDNVRLQPANAVTDQSLAATLGWTLRQRTELWEISFAPRLQAQRYRYDHTLDHDNQWLDLGLNRAGERWSWGFGANAARDTTLTSELGSSGLTAGNRRHQSLDLALTPGWRASERLSLGASLAWQSSRYLDEPSPDLVNYEYRRAGISASYALSESAALSLSGSAGRYQSRTPGSQSDDASLSMGMRYSLAPRWTMSVSAGPSRVRADSGSRQGLNYSAQLGTQSARNSLSLTISRGISQSGRGELTRREDLGLQFGAALTERLSATLGLSAIHSSDAVPSARFSIGDVRYGRATAGLHWLLAQNWSVNLTAGKSLQRGAGDETAQGADVRFALGWSGGAHVY